MSQNLLLNGGFEDITDVVIDSRSKRDSLFYATHWFQATNATVDIIRDTDACDTLHIASFDPNARICTAVVDGNYCIGFVSLGILGGVEHLTGTLRNRLEKDTRYEISFFLKKSFSMTPLIPKGIGIKLHEDSAFFDIESITAFDSWNNKPWGYYDNLFANPVVPDFAIDKYVMDTIWQEYSFEYVARGGEKYLSLGVFSYDDNAAILKQFRKIRKNPIHRKMMRFIRKDRSLALRRFYPENQPLDEEAYYYFIDRLSVITID